MDFVLAQLFGVCADLIIVQFRGMFSGLRAVAALGRASGPRACAVSLTCSVDLKLVLILAVFSSVVFVLVQLLGLFNGHYARAALRRVCGSRACAAPWLIHWTTCSCSPSLPAVDFVLVQLRGTLS